MAKVFVLPGMKRGSSLLVFGAHPDDAVRACGGAMLQAMELSCRLEVVKLTDGAALYGPQAVSEGRQTAMARRQEEIRAIESLGAPAESLRLLGFPDGGLEALRNSYFETSGLPYYDPWLAADRVEDEACYRPGAKFFGSALVEAIRDIIERANPTHVLTHCSRDRHPDHRATTFFVKRAITDLLLDNRLRRSPAIFEYLTYHTRTKWPANPGELIDSARAVELDLPGKVTDLRLTRDQAMRKNLAQECFVPILGRAYMDPWMRSNEIYWQVDLLGSER